MRIMVTHYYYSVTVKRSITVIMINNNGGISPLGLMKNNLPEHDILIYIKLWLWPIRSIFFFNKSFFDCVLSPKRLTENNNDYVDKLKFLTPYCRSINIELPSQSHPVSIHFDVKGPCKRKLHQLFRHSLNNVRA